MKTIRVFGIFIFLFQGQSRVQSDIISATTQGCKVNENDSPMLRLKRHLFCDYDTNVRPAVNHQTVTNVTIHLFPKMIDFDMWTSAMTLHAWIALHWNDAHLTWTAADYDGVPYIHVSSDEIWVPDISVYNSGDMSLDQKGIPPTHCLVFSNGGVICVPATTYTSRCNTNFTYWPYDKHECRITFGSWSHTGEEVDFHLGRNGYTMDGYMQNTEWDVTIVNATKIIKRFEYYPNDTSSQIIYKFSLRRHYGLMHTTFVTPAFALMLLTLTVLWLDTRSTERMAVASVNFICHMLCISDLHWQLPHNGSNTPNIMLFYRDSLALAAFSLILTAFLRKLQSINVEAPSWISSTTTFVLNNKAGRFLILSDEESKMSSGILGNEPEENSDVTKSIRSKESSWRHFAAIVEWVSFFCVVFTYIVILFTLVPTS